jgi:hypothetical protein
LSGGALGAQEYNRIEEDWRLVVNVPDPSIASPQIALDMSPAPGSPLSGLFLINYRDAPDFRAGGVQVELWHDALQLDQASSSAAVMELPDEAFTFTLYMERRDGRLYYGVERGQSETWGDLGDEGLHVGCYDVWNTFAAYRSSHSVENATIVLGSTRVQSLKLLQVRKYRADGPGIDYEGPRNVYP